MAVSAEGGAPDTDDVAIETDGLTMRYGSLRAVDDLSLEVPVGSVFGLIGPNGAGKTTTIQILATLLEPTSGHAWVMGHSSTEEPEEVRRSLGYMPDFFGTYDDVRVGEYLEFFAGAYRLRPERRRSVSKDLLELVDLTHKKDSFVESLSRGMKQRLGLARALIHDPEVLILDEPASGLDPRARIELRELILELKKMGKTIVISSHILPELEEMCTDIGIIEAGRLLAQGSPAEMLHGLADTRSFRLRCADEDSLERARGILEGREGIAGVTVENGSLQFLLMGDDEAAADVIYQLVGKKVRVSGFADVTTGLEELFMQITKGVVQ